MFHRAAGRLVIATLLAVGMGGGAAAQAQAPPWLAGDRVLVSEGGTLYALALGVREVYAAGPAGVLVYDFTRAQWNAPIAAIGDYPVGQRITGMAHDRASGELFVTNAAGDAYRWVPGFERWEPVFTAERESLSPEVRAALARRPGAGARDPVLDAVRGSLGLDPRLRRWPIMDALAGERPGEYWVATGGGGLVHFDSRGLERNWLPWGLLSRSTAALAFDGQRLWFGGDGRSARNGVTAATPSLTHWAHYEASEDGAPAGFVAEILPARGRVWFASSDGVYRYDGDAAGRAAWTGWTPRQGLPSVETTSLAAMGDLVWVGTRRGLAAIAGDVIEATFFADRPVHRLAVHRDTLWVATADGLFIGTAASALDAPFEAAPGAADHAALRGPVDDVVAGEEGVYALAGGALYRWAEGGWSGALRDGAIERIAPLIRLAHTDGRLWIAGGRGIAWMRGPGAGWRTLEIPRDIQRGPVVDVLVVGEHVWVATPDGATRLRLPDRS